MHTFWNVSRKQVNALAMSGLLSLSASAEVLRDVSFNNLPEGLYSTDMLNADWKNPATVNGIDEGRVSVVSSPSYSEKSLRVRYPALAFGPDSSGAQWTSSFSGKDELFATYFLYFPSGWNGVQGGMLPGLGGARCPVDGDTVNGYNGFSARFMFKPEMKLAVQCCHMDMLGSGQDFPLDFTVQTAVWYKLTQRIKLNAPGQKNGTLQVWINDRQVLMVDTLRFRAIDTVKIDRFCFSTFYGGKTADWAPQTDQHVYFDEFKVFTDANRMSIRSPRDITAHDKFTLRKTSTGEIVISLPKGHSGAMSVCDLRGRTIARPEYLGNNTFRFKPPHSGPGAYVVRAENATGVVLQRIVSAGRGGRRIRSAAF